MIVQLKNLPFTNLNYKISEVGDIYQNDKILDNVIIDKKPFVEINWISGKKFYEKAILILSAFGKIGLDVCNYDKVKIIYRDGDISNCFLSNLTYIHTSGPIQSKITDFYLIPNFENYAINTNGILINLETGKIKKWSSTKEVEKGSKTAGYQYSTLYRNNISRTVYQHRILCLVFKEFSGVYNNLTVNHINCNKADNELNNLEWATYAENNQHAWNNNLKLNNRPHILMRDLITEEVLKFRSVRECSYYLGDSNGFYVSFRLKNETDKIYPDYKLFKRDDGTAWPELKIEDLPSKNIIVKNGFIARNIFTGDLISFNNVNEAKILFDIDSWIVLEHARCSKSIPFKGYNFRFLSDSKIWPIHTKQHLEIYKDYPTAPGDGVIMTDVYDNKEIFFTSIDKCCNKMAIKQSHLRTLIFNGRLFNKRYAFKIFKLKVKKTKDNQQRSCLY